MPLQYSAEYPMVPPVQYTQSYMPSVPLLNLGGELDSLVPFAAISAANVLSSAATRTPLRTYMYNVCVDQNWRNQTFAQIVQLTVKAGVYLLARGFYRDIATAIQEAATSICAGFTGNLYAQHVEFHGRLAPDVVQNAQECSRQLTILISEITNFERTGRVTNHTAAPTSSYPGVELPPSSYPGGSIAGFSGGSFGVASAPAAPSFNSVSMSASRFADNSVINVPSTPEVFKFPDPVQKSAPSVGTTAQLPQPANRQEPIIKDMNREKHSITIFDTVILDEADTTRVLVQASRGFQSDEATKGRLFYSNAVFEDNFDEFIASGRAKLVADADPHPEARHGFYRVFGYYLKRFSQAVDITSVTHDLLNTNGMFALITKLRSVSSTLNLEGEHHRESMMKLGFLVDLDNWFTDLISSFLQHNLRSGITFTSFVEDYKTLREAIPVHHGKAAFELLCLFEKKLLRMLSARRTTLALMDDVESGKVTEVEATDDGVWSYLLPIPASVTYCPLLSVELGFKLKPGQDSCLIDKTHAPVLYEMAASHREHADIIGIDTLEAWMCTVDNRLYRIHATSVSGETSYYISCAR